MLLRYLTDEGSIPMPRVSLWLVSAWALVSFGVIFVMGGVPDGFLVLRNAATFSAADREYLVGQLALVVGVQVFVTGALQLYLHSLDRYARWDHVVFLWLFVWGSLIWPLTMFGTVYWYQNDYEYRGQGSWGIITELSLFAIPLSFLAFVLMMVREVLTGRSARAPSSPSAGTRA